MRSDISVSPRALSGLRPAVSDFQSRGRWSRFTKWGAPGGGRAEASGGAFATERTQLRSFLQALQLTALQTASLSPDDGPHATRLVPRRCLLCSMEGSAHRRWIIRHFLAEARNRTGRFALLRVRRHRLKLSDDGGARGLWRRSGS